MLRLLDPPAPIITPADVPGSHAADDATVAALIEAVTQSIEGPTGWLGRALGEQTLELSGSGFAAMAGLDGGIWLPCPPIIEVESVTYLDASGDEQEVADGGWRAANGRLWSGAGLNWPTVGTFADAVRIRYRAGYDGNDAATGGTGNVPGVAKQAIILSVQHLAQITSENLFLSSEDVEGIGRRQYVVSDRASALIETTCQRLLSGLWVPVA